MKALKTIVLLFSLIMLAACSKHPSALVGVWKSGEQGMFSAEIVLTLKGDGTGMLVTGMGMFGGANDRTTWEFGDDKLTLRKSSGSATTFTVVSKSKTDLVLQETAGGTLLSFKRIGDS